MGGQTITLRNLDLWLAGPGVISASAALKRPSSLFVRDFRLLQKAKETRHVQVRLRQLNPVKIELLLIRTARRFRDQGHGSWALALLCLLADRYGVVMVVDVCPADDYALGLGDLIEWYEEHSFVRDDEDDKDDKCDSCMTRVPQAVAQV